MEKIPLFRVFISKDVDGPLLETVHSGYVGQGPCVENLERELSERIGNPHCLTLSAGTHGLHLALMIEDIGFGDEVITTPLSCFATTAPILMQKAEPVWADIDPESLNIDLESVEKRITKRTKAIICMHWGGYPCPMQELGDIASKYQIPLIEDAAHAFGSTYRNTIIGDCNHSDYAMFSFQAIKAVTGGDGGCLFLKDENKYISGKLLRWYGIDREGPRIDMRCEEDIIRAGTKFHMNDIAATICLGNLPYADENIKKTRENAMYYRRELADISGITLIQNETDRQSSYWLFTILVEDRSGFSRKMGEKGIMVSRVHERNDKHSCVARFKRNDLRNLEYVIDRMICLPVGWWVKKEDRERVVEAIKSGW